MLFDLAILREIAFSRHKPKKHHKIKTQKHKTLLLFSQETLILFSLSFFFLFSFFLFVINSNPSIMTTRPLPDADSPNQPRKRIRRCSKLEDSGSSGHHILATDIFSKLRDSQVDSPCEKSTPTRLGEVVGVL